MLIGGFAQSRPARVHDTMHRRRQTTGLGARRARTLALAVQSELIVVQERSSRALGRRENG